MELKQRSYYKIMKVGWTKGTSRCSLYIKRPQTSSLYSSQLKKPEGKDYNEKSDLNCQGQQSGRLIMTKIDKRDRVRVCWLYLSLGTQTFAQEKIKWAEGPEKKFLGLPDRAASCTIVLKHGEARTESSIKLRVQKCKG